MAMVRVQPRGTRGINRELGPGPPANPLIVTGERLDVDVDVEPGQTFELFHHHSGFQLPLVRELTVLPVASAALASAREPAARRHPVLRGVKHLDGVPEQEPVVRPARGDAHSHGLAGQGMTHEHHPVVIPRDAVATMGDLADLRLELRADQRHPRVVLLLLAHSPRLTEPTIGPSRRSSAPWEERSCQGTLVTITPGVKCRRPLSRNALWLCNSCSYQRPTTYSGI